MSMFMQPRLQFYRQKKALWVAVLLGQIAVVAASAKPAASAKSSASPRAGITNQVVEIPQSVFEMPSATDKVKDPFFPNSTRLNPVPGPITKRPEAILADLVLKGLSGRPESPLATINNVTFGVGEQHDVSILTRRVPVRCLEINLNDETVTIEAAGQRRVLRFPRRK
jgi:hypothetical protein